MWLFDRWLKQSSMQVTNETCECFCLFLKQKLGNKATLWWAYGATTHCHQDKPGLLSSASLGWQQTSSWLALAARGNKSGLGMRLRWLGNEAIWSGNEAKAVWVWGYSGLGMRLQQYEYEATVVWEWSYSSLGVRLQLTLFSSVATAFLRSKG